MDLNEKKELLEVVVMLVGYASIVSAAIFGMIGLFAEYKIDGKTTVWGKVAAVGIALSAAFGLTSAVLQRKADAAQRAIAAGTAAEERNRAKIQYDRQIAHLVGLNSGIAGANAKATTLLGDMGTSLASQDRILADQRRLIASAQASLTMTSRLQMQQRRGTTKILRGIWDEANRVSGATIVAGVAFQCAVDSDKYFPILAEEARAELTVVPMAKVAAERVPLTRFRASYVEDTIDLVAIDHKATLHRDTMGEVGFQQVSRFTPFAFGANRLKTLTSPENWDGMAVELRIIGIQPDLAQRVAAIARTPLLGREALAQKYDLSGGITGGQSAGEDPRVAVLPCQADMFLFINDRQVAQAQGLVVQVWEGRGDRVGQVIVKFPIVPVDVDDFDRFSEASGGW